MMKYPKSIKFKVVAQDKDQLVPVEVATVRYFLNLIDC